MNAFKTVILCLSLLLVACNQEKPSLQASENSPSDFVGCYTINQQSPAQIKISEQDGKYTMQMKEPQGASSVWDSPESLELVDVGSAWQFFAVNQLDLNKSDVEAVLARPDKMMVLAKIKSASKNINPRLDSAFVVYIFRGSNTIYQVPCDDTPITFPHH